MKRFLPLIGALGIAGCNQQKINISNDELIDNLPKDTLEMRVLDIPQETVKCSCSHEESNVKPFYDDLNQPKDINPKIIKRQIGPTQALILEQMNKVNEMFKGVKGYENFKEEDLKYFNAMIKTESTGYASKYDPAQISNYGDCALNEFQKTEKDGLLGLINDSNFKDFKNIKHAIRKDNRWQYETTGINPELSILGGWLWLAHNKYEVNRTLKFGQKRIYTVEKGDSIWKIAKKKGVIIPNTSQPMKYTMNLFQNWNPNTDLNKLKIGQKIYFCPAEEEISVKGRDIEDALERYNGGGDSEYLNKIKSIL